MSLRDQLLKAGLVSADKAKKADTEARKQSHQQKKNKGLAAEDAARKAEEQRQRDEEAAQKRERDRQLNREREAEKQRRAELARVRQLLAAHRQNEPKAEIQYNFLAPDKRFIRYVRVTPPQQKQLARGQLGIVSNDENEFDFVLVSRDTVLAIAAAHPERVLLLHEPSSGNDDGDNEG